MHRKTRAKDNSERVRSYYTILHKARETRSNISKTIKIKAAPKATTPAEKEQKNKNQKNARDGHLESSKRRKNDVTRNHKKTPHRPAETGGRRPRPNHRHEKTKQTRDNKSNTSTTAQRAIWRSQGATAAREMTQQTEKRIRQRQTKPKQKENMPEGQTNNTAKKSPTQPTAQRSMQGNTSTQAAQKQFKTLDHNCNHEVTRSPSSR